DLDAGRADDVHVEHSDKVVDVVANKILGMSCGGLESRLEGRAVHLLVAALDQGIGALLNPGRGLAVCRPSIGRVVFAAAIGRGIVRWRQDDAICESGLASTIVDENSTRNDGGGRYPVVALDNRLDTVGREHFEGGALGGSRRGVGIFP